MCLVSSRESSCPWYRKSLVCEMLNAEIDFSLSRCPSVEFPFRTRNIFATRLPDRSIEFKRLCWAELTNDPINLTTVSAATRLTRIGILPPLLDRLAARIRHQLRSHTAQHIASRFRGQDDWLHDRRRDLSQHPANCTRYTLMLVFLTRHAD